MVKLYYTPTSCGASSFICSYIGKLNFECEVVDLATHKTESGVDFYTINPKGNVPSIVLDDGTVLNENLSCLEYIADQCEINNLFLAPAKGTSKRYEVNQLLSFLATELHSTIGLLFNSAATQPEIRVFVNSMFDKKMKYLQNNILNDDRKFAYGNSFTIIDAYLHIILSWTGYVHINISNYPIAERYYKNICDIEEVKNAKKRMAEIPKTIL
jgi:glutathione S-transferase